MMLGAVVSSSLGPLPCWGSFPPLTVATPAVYAPAFSYPNSTVTALTAAATSSVGGSAHPVDFTFEQERQWLEMFPELGSVGVKATKRLPAGYYVAKMRSRTNVEGVENDEFAVKINDHCYRAGMSLKQYESLQPNVLHMHAAAELPQGGGEVTQGQNFCLNPKYPKEGFANCRLTCSPYGLLVQAMEDIFPQQPLSLWYGSQFWFGGKPYSNNPDGDASHTCVSHSG